MYSQIIKFLCETVVKQTEPTGELLFVGTPNSDLCMPRVHRGKVQLRESRNVVLRPSRTYPGVNAIGAGPEGSRRTRWRCRGSTRGCLSSVLDTKHRKVLHKAGELLDLSLRSPDLLVLGLHHQWKQKQCSVKQSW